VSLDNKEEHDQPCTEVPALEDKSYEQGEWRRLPQIVHDQENIKGFFGEYRWLSNFGKATVMLDGVQYESVECAYQAAKWPTEKRDFFSHCTNRESIAFNRANQPDGYPIEEWDAIKADVMAGLLVQKFDPELNPQNYEKLLATGDKYIEETNWWNDTFWGKNLQGEGKNTLGRLLMEIRSRLSSL